MPRPLRIAFLTGLTVLGACGLFGDDSAETLQAGGTEAPQAVAPADPADAAAPSEAAVDPAADATSTTQTDAAGSQTDAAAAVPSPGDAASEPQAAAAGAAQAAASSEQATQPAQSSEIEERLEQLVESQEALTERIDSLAQALAPVTDSVRGPAGSGEVLGQAGQEVRNFGVGIVWSVIVLIVFNLAIRGFVWLLDQLAERNASRRLFYKRLVPIVRIVLWIFAAYLIIRVIFQVDYQGLVAAAAAVGVAVGFAAQDLLKNLFGGLILVFDQPFQVGDKIKVGGTYGEVVSIGLRSTRMVTPDDNLVSVPNAEVVDNQVANANAGQLHCQVVTDLYLPGWANEDEAKRIAFQAASSSKYVYLKKPIVVLVSDVFKETFLTRVRVKAYVLDPRLEFLFQSDVTERARAGFRSAGLLRAEHMRGRLVERSAVGVAPEQPTDPDVDAED